MLGYIFAIIAVLVMIPLVFLLMRGRRKPGPTAAETEAGSGSMRQEPSQEGGSVDDESISRPSKPEA